MASSGTLRCLKDYRRKTMCMVKKNNSITSNQVKNTLRSSACYRQTLQSRDASMNRHICLPEPGHLCLLMMILYYIYGNMNNKLHIL